MGRSRKLEVHHGVALWSAGDESADIDVWFLHAFADSHLCYREAYSHLLSERIRILVFDLPGHGASPPRRDGLTVEKAAQLWLDLIGSLSPRRRVVLVAHSMAGIIATRVAERLHPAPALVISIEGNLTSADAYLSGQAAQFDDADRFYASFESKVREMAARDEAFRRYSGSVCFADPRTLWTLGRSVLDYPAPGADYLRLGCPTIYYWDSESTTPDSRAFLERHDVRSRKTSGASHWPMTQAPSQFYAAVEEDVSSACEPGGR
jgi:pimeloyl-ACP methyl ester carboxylesterase